MRVLKIREHPDPIGLDTTGEDVNELTISGHIEHELELTEDDYGQWVCAFVLTHTTTHYESGHWELQYYDITLYGARPSPATTSPDRRSSSPAVGPSRPDHTDRIAVRASIHAHRIITAHGPHRQPTTERGLIRGRRQHRNR
jgi:hypothetical protein